jgi:hypothetical protein
MPISSIDIELEDGTPLASVELGVVGPRGPRGFTGPQGIRGVQGERGEQGEEGGIGPQGERGETGATGDEGPQGPQGESPYELAVRNGFSGTEAEWVASLKGEKGDTGDEGPQGPQGPAGDGIVDTTSNYSWSGSHNFSSNIEFSGASVTIQNDTKPLFRSALGLSDGTASLSLAGLTTSATTYNNGATFAYNNAAAITNHRNALGLGTSSAPAFARFEVSDAIIYNDTNVTFSVNSNSKIWLFNMYNNGQMRMALTRVNGNLYISTAGKFGWSTDAQEINLRTAIGESSAGVVEINNGTTGTFRDLKLRNLESTGTISGIINATGDVVEETTTARTLALADSGKYIRCTNSATTTITVPTDSSVNFPTGSVVYFRRHSGALALSASGVTINNDAAASVPAGGTCALKKVAANTWDFI